MSTVQSRGPIGFRVHAMGAQAATLLASQDTRRPQYPQGSHRGLL